MDKQILQGRMHTYNTVITVRWRNWLAAKGFYEN
jgi:hypothetical protein